MSQLRRILTSGLSSACWRVRITRRKCMVVVAGLWLLSLTLSSGGKHSVDDGGFRVMRQSEKEEVMGLRDGAIIQGKNLTTHHEQKTGINISTNWYKETQEPRHHLLNRVCQSKFSSSMPTVNSQVLKQILVDDVHKVVYCVIPKAACTSWKEALVFLTGKLSHNDPQKIRHDVHDDKFLESLGLRYLHTYQSSQDIITRLREYTKIITVRHPFERLLSASRDKFAQKNQWTTYFHHKFGRRIVQAYRKNPSRASLMSGSDVTFEEFLRFISDEQFQHDYKFNVHWMTFQELCQPCQIDYDYIIKFETLADDSSHIIQDVFHSSLGLFPRVNSKSLASSNLTESNFRHIPRDIIEQLLRLYRDDFGMFGYEWTVG